MFDGVNDIIFKQPNRIVYPLNWVEHIPFAFKLVEVVKPRIIVELGVHSGNSFCAFNQAVEMLKLTSKCYGVDTWLGDSQAGFYDSTIFEALSKYVKEHYNESAVLLKCTFDEALDTFEDNSIDILHIDGLHDYDSVFSDFQKWKRKLSDFSVVLLHDTQVEYDGYGVQKFWKEIHNVFSDFEFTHCNGLGVVLFGKNQNKDTYAFIKYLKSTPQYVYLLELMGAQIFYRANSTELEKKNNEIYNITAQYLNSTSYKLGNMLLKPFKLLKNI
jgi:hypothetical protein